MPMGGSDMVSLKKVTNRWLYLLASALWLSATPVHADDTEIYFVEAKGGGQANILFLMDTSGSIRWCGASSGCSSGQRTRMEELKSSFSSLVDSLGGNIRIGLGRFDSSNNAGGYITYPVRGLDEPTGTLTAVAAVGKGRDDAVQRGGTLKVTDLTMNFPSDGQAGGRAGFIFRGLSLPRNAKVVSATMTLRSGSPSTSTVLNVLSNYEVGQGLPDFATANLFQRNWHNSVGDVWQTPIQFTVTEYWARGKDQEIDVAQLVQRAIEDTNWCGGADMVLGFQGLDNNTRNIYTADVDSNENSWPAQLKVTWTSQPLSLHPDPSLLSAEDYEKTLSCMGGQAAQIKENKDDAGQSSSGTVSHSGNGIDISRGSSAAFRFVEIPVDARASLTYPDVVRKATLYLSGQNAYSSLTGSGWFGNSPTDITDGSTVTLKVRGVGGNAAAIQASSNNISSRNFVSETASYTTAARASLFNGTHVHEIDVTDMVKAMLSQGGWARNGALMFEVQTSDNRYFTLASRDGGVASSARLVLDVSLSTLDHLVPRVRDDLKAAVNSLTANGGTPLGESYTEASRYMMGLPVNYGSNSVAAVKNGQNFISPLASADQECASSHIVMMTDGQPSRDNGVISSTANVMGVNSNTLSAACKKSVSETGSGSTAELERSMACMTELAKWNLDASKNTIKRQVNTHMVLFHLSESDLAEAKKVTVAGEGQAVAAGSEEALLEAFSKIVNADRKR